MWIGTFGPWPAAMLVATPAYTASSAPVETPSRDASRIRLPAATAMSASASNRRPLNAARSTRYRPPSPLYRLHDRGHLEPSCRRSEVLFIAAPTGPCESVPRVGIREQLENGAGERPGVAGRHRAD